MSISSLIYPRHKRTGSGTVTANVNSFQASLTEIKPAAIVAICFDATIGKLTGSSFTAKNERVTRVFSPIGGSWDYSEVD